MSRLRFRTGFCVALLAISLIFLAAPATSPTAAAAEPGPNARAIERVMQVQDRHTGRLMALPNVVGTATGLNPAGKPVIKVFLAQAGAAGIPANLEGVPVVVEVTGVFFALPKPSSPPGQDKEEKVDPTSRFDRPVPIGVSTGNANECSAGTIGCRVRDGNGVVYALSNNHVYARENNASRGEDILQPGLYDTRCEIIYPDQVIGELADYVDIDFGSEGTNTVDAAIALCTTERLGNSTPLRPDGSDDGYGMPKSTTVDAAVGQTVQKYGRTTGLTKGEVTEINANVWVGYRSGTARFVDQIIVSGHKFIKAGDSGSLLVTDSDSDPDRNPVGLLFAGSGNGKRAIANRIDLVLEAFEFDVSVDGE